MPRFHLNAYDGVALPDSTGRDLADLDEARAEAVRLAGELMRDGATDRRLGDNWRIEVADDTGRSLFWLDLSAF